MGKVGLLLWGLLNPEEMKIHPDWSEEGALGTGALHSPPLYPLGRACCLF